MNEALTDDQWSFIQNWGKSIGVEVYGQVASSIDPLEMWLQTQSSSTLTIPRENQRKSSDRVD